MIAKKYSTTLYTDALFALSKRLSKNHPRYINIQEEYQQKIAGDLGEKFVMRMLEQVKLPYRFYIFHNVALYTESLFQMDFLIISPYYAMILEVKNIKGEIIFTTTPPQLFRKLENGESRAYDSPVLQLEEYEYQLKQFFRSKNISLPVHGAIVFAFSTSCIKVPPPNITVLTRKKIKPFLRKQNTGRALLSNKELDDLKDMILQAHTEFLPFPLTDYFSIQHDSIIKGVECNHCSFIGMNKIQHNWICPRCKVFHKKAHEQALKDYFLIYKNTISNKECQHFLKLNNKHEATRILKNNMLRKTGQSRNTKYSMIFS